MTALRPFLFVSLLASLLPIAPVRAAEEHAQHAQHAPSAMKARVELGSSAAFAPDGTLLVVSKQGQHVVLQRSADQGQTWSEPLKVNAQPEAISADGENRPKIALTSDGGILVSWTQPLGKPYSGAIRLARSDDGSSFAPPLTVHRDTAEITHRFETLQTLTGNRVLVAWIDKRDLEAAKGKGNYRGAAIYSALSTDGGRSFLPERKVADHSCECCRIASAIDTDGALLLMWRHVYAPNERDHALARLKADGSADSVQRATYDRWRVDACPHHGPSLVVDAQGLRHAVWFNVNKEGEGRVFYGRLPRGNESRVDGQRSIGGPRAAHADLALGDDQLAIVWSEFDGEKTRLDALVSRDNSRNFEPLSLASTEGAADQPRLIQHRQKLYAFWRTEKEGFRLIPLP